MKFEELSFLAKVLDPVTDQPPVRIAANVMRAIPDEVSCYLNDLFFGDNNTVYISRKDILSIRRCDLDLFTISVLYWGFPKNNRQRCTYAIRSWHNLTELVKRTRFHNLSLDYYNGLIPEMMGIHGLNISTFSKLFYFSRVSIDGNECVIMDSFVERGINDLEGVVFDSLKESVSRSNRYQSYFSYLSEIAHLSRMINVPTQNLEYALWMAGKKNL